jgi:hypothetical protein
MRSYESIRLNKYNNVIRTLAKDAPTMPISAANTLASQMANAETDLYIAKAALAVLTGPLGYNSHGTPPENLKSVREAVKWALDQATYAHGWVVCSPVSDAMNKLMDEIEKDGWGK